MQHLGMQYTCIMGINETKIYDRWGSIYHVDDIGDAIDAGPSFWKSAMYDRRLVILRNPDASPKDFITWCASFGSIWNLGQYQMMKEVVRPVIVDGKEEFYGVFSNTISPRLGNKGMYWHADNPDRGDVLPMRALRMVQCPNPKEGRTGFLNVEIAWESLPDDDKKEWRTRMVEQHSWYAKDTNIQVYDAVKRHPITGVESPRANDYCVAGTDRNDRWIRDVLSASGQRLGGVEMKKLVEFMETVPECIYYHEWKEGDIIVYDNSAFIHNRTALKLAEGEERVLWRANIDHDLGFRIEKPRSVSG